MGATLTPAAPPFTRKRVGPHYVWGADLMVAHAFAAKWGLGLYLTDTPYQVGKLIGDGIRLVIYPHTTTGTGNQHLRVRDENSRDTRRAQALMVLLDRAAGFNCTFSFHWPVNALAHQLRGQALSDEGLRAVKLIAAPAAQPAPAQSVTAICKLEGAAEAPQFAPHTGGGREP